MKRSSQIALVLMGATAVGAGAYAMTPPRRDCPPPSQAQPAGAPLPRLPGAAAPEPCVQPRRWSSGAALYGSRWGSSGGSTWRNTSTRTPQSSAFRPSTSATSRTSTTTTSRGGFGSTGRSVSSGS